MGLLPALRAMPTPQQPAKRIKRLVAPANESELAAFVAACKRAEMEPADTLRKLAAAYVREVRERGLIVQPMRLRGLKDLHE